MKMEEIGWDRSIQYYMFYVKKKKFLNYFENYVINVIRVF